MNLRVILPSLNNAVPVLTGQDDGAEARATMLVRLGPTDPETHRSRLMMTRRDQTTGEKRLKIQKMLIG